MIPAAYYIITFGCAMNFSDSERIAAILENQGYIKAPSKYQADLVVIVACAVRQRAADRIYGNIKELKVKSEKLKVEIIATGCLLERDIKTLKCKDIKIKKLSDFANNYQIGEFLKIAPKYQRKNQASVPIMTGCDNFCSYCAVPYTRGREYSRPAEEILSEVFNLIKNGYKEITLLGQNVNSYKSESQNPKSEFYFQYFGIQDPGFGISNIISFPNLLKLINRIPGDFKIKFLTSHPKDMSDELIEAIAGCEKVDKEKLHLPVQSGDDDILAKMNRKYSAEHYENLIQKIRSRLPDVKITTDIIVGFPGETEEQFKNTAKLFQKIGFSGAYISCYSPRQGTEAAKWKDNVPIKEKKRRKFELEQSCV